MSVHRHHHHIAAAVFILYCIDFVLGLVGSLFAIGSAAQIICWSVCSSFFITASALMAVKMAREHHDIPSAGFTMLTISYSLYFTAIESSVTGQGDAFAMGVYMFIPAIILINYYHVFKWWLKILALASCIPFVYILVMSYVSRGDYVANQVWYASGFTLLELTGVLWGYFFWNHSRMREQNPM